MKALLLAGGLGTRLRPLTDTIPKPLLSVQGRPLLERQLELLGRHGVADVLVNTHYLADQINDFAAQWNAHNGVVKIKTVYETTLLGSGGTLIRNKEFFIGTKSFFVVYGDVLNNIDLTKMHKHHTNSKNLITIACYEEAHPEKKGIVNFDDQMKITGFKEKPNTIEITSRYANAGVYIIDPIIFQYLPNNTATPFDFGHDIFPTLLRRHVDMGAYLHSGLILDIGDLGSYNRANEEILL